MRCAKGLIAFPERVGLPGPAPSRLRKILVSEALAGAIHAKSSKDSTSR